MSNVRNSAVAGVAKAAPSRWKISLTHKWRVPVLGLTVLLTAFMLRSPLSSVGPLAKQIGTQFALGSAAVGLVTTLPLVVFVIASPMMSRLGRRLGAEVVIMAGLALIVVGSLLRWIPSIPSLYIGTVIVALGIAAPNVLLSSIVQRDFPKHIGLVTALYTSVLSIGGGLASLTALPLANGLGWGWSATMGIVAIPCIIALLLWLPFEREHTKNTSLQNVKGTAFRTGRAWQLAVMFGAQSVMFYSVVAWFPQILQNKGLSAPVAAVYVGGCALIGIVSSLLIPPISTRRPSQIGIAVIVGFLMVLGNVGVAFSSGQMAGIFTLVIGLSAGGGFSLAMTLVSLKTRTSLQAGELSGMVQSIGYIISAIAPVLFGFIHDQTGSWILVEWLMIALAVLFVVMGIFAGRRGYILTSELPSPAARLEQTQTHQMEPASPGANQTK